MYRSEMEIKTKNGNHRDIQIILKALQRQTLLSKGCVCCRIRQDLDDLRLLSFECEWESWEAMKTFIASPYCLELLRLTELSDHPPRIRIERKAIKDGFELIRFIRNTLSDKPGFLFSTI